MKVKLFNSNDMRQNTYLYYNEKSCEGILIDAGCSINDINAISLVISENKIRVKAILLTHGHFDHIITLEDVKSLTGAMVYSHESERLLLEDLALNLSAIAKKTLKVIPDMFFKDMDVFEIGDTVMTVLHTPGHTPGGVCYYDAKNGNLFTGDVLFMNSIGRSDLPQGNSAALLESIKSKLLALPEDTNVYPGHGMATTIGREKASNPFLF